MKFARSVFPKTVEVYETFNAGSMKGILVMDANNDWHTAWEADTVQQTTEGNQTFSVKIKVSVYKDVVAGPMFIDLYHFTILMSIMIHNNGNN